MLKYDYHSSIRTLSEKSADCVICACRGRPQAVLSLRDECQRILCELEGALFSEFLPPLDRSGLAAYAHTLCALADSAIIYSKLASTGYAQLSQRRFESATLSLCEILKESAAMLGGIKKSSEIPRLEEFRKLKSSALDGARERSQAPLLISSRENMLFALSDAFDSLVELILKSI